MARQNREMKEQLKELQQEIATQGWEKEDEPIESEKTAEDIVGPLGDLMKVFQSVQQLQNNLEKLNLDSQELNLPNPEECS